MVGETPGPANGSEDVRRALIDACEVARRSGDSERFAAAALALPSAQHFGAHPGVIPGLLYEAYNNSAGCVPATQARLAAALARAWVYGGEAGRAREFADQALSLASDLGDDTVIADALDSALLARWGPDDYEERRRLASQLGDVVAHITDPELRLSGCLWRLTSAWECLDLVAVQRQMRALDVLADESGSSRVAFFADSRRAMYELAIGDIEVADELITRIRLLGAASGEVDTAAVIHELDATRARRVGDVAALAAEAAAFESFGRGEGIASVCAEAAVFWTEAGEPAKAESLVRLVVGNGLHGVVRDVDFLLTITSIVRVAATLDLDDVTAAGATLLEPYAGRAVLNAGAVTFHGLVDEYLYRAHRALGRDDANQWRDVAVSTYRRLGANWWLDQLDEPFPADVTHPRPVPLSLDATITRRWLFRRQPTGPWSIGVESRNATFPDRRGLHYLRELLAHPGLEISCLELSERAEGHAATGVWQGDLGDVLDATAKAAYRGRLDELDAEIAEAEDWSDTGRRERAECERQALIDQLAAATGLGGRRRRIGAHDERARIAVRKAIASAITSLEQHDPAVARILRTTIRTGTTCCYEPNPDATVQWIVE